MWLEQKLTKSFPTPIPSLSTPPLEVRDLTIGGRLREVDNILWGIRTIEEAETHGWWEESGWETLMETKVALMLLRAHYGSTGELSRYSVGSRYFQKSGIRCGCSPNQQQ